MRAIQVVAVVLEESAKFGHRKKMTDEPRACPGLSDFFDPRLGLLLPRPYCFPPPTLVSLRRCLQMSIRECLPLRRTDPTNSSVSSIDCCAVGSALRATMAPCGADRPNGPQSREALDDTCRVAEGPRDPGEEGRWRRWGAVTEFCRIGRSTGDGPIN